MKENEKANNILENENLKEDLKQETINLSSSNPEINFENEKKEEIKSISTKDQVIDPPIPRRNLFKRPKNGAISNLPHEFINQII